MGELHRLTRLCAVMVHTQRNIPRTTHQGGTSRTGRSWQREAVLPRDRDGPAPVGMEACPNQRDRRPQKGARGRHLRVPLHHTRRHPRRAAEQDRLPHRGRRRLPRLHHGERTRARGAERRRRPARAGGVHLPPRLGPSRGRAEEGRKAEVARQAQHGEATEGQGRREGAREPRASPSPSRRRQLWTSRNGECRRYHLMAM